MHAGGGDDARPSKRGRPDPRAAFGSGCPVRFSVADRRAGLDATSRRARLGVSRNP